jgi:predicted transcriptional regulator
MKEKLRVIREVESNPTLTRVEVAKRLNMPVTTVKRIMGKKAFNKLSLLISLPA